MTADLTLQRLALLRRRRAQQALEALVIQARLLHRAEQQAEQAARADRNHLREARTKERDLINSLAGRVVSHAAIIRTQTELDRAALETVRLRAATARAQANLVNRQNARAEAGANFRRCEGAAMALDLICRQEAARRSRGEAALGEAEEEDRAPSLQSAGRGGGVAGSPR